MYRTISICLYYIVRVTSPPLQGIPLSRCFPDPPNEEGRGGCVIFPNNKEGAAMDWFSLLVVGGPVIFLFLFGGVVDEEIKEKGGFKIKRRTGAR